MPDPTPTPVDLSAARAVAKDMLDLADVAYNAGCVVGLTPDEVRARANTLTQAIDEIERLRGALQEIASMTIGEGIGAQMLGSEMYAEAPGIARCALGGGEGHA